MKTIDIKIALTEREHELLVAAHLDKPGPERIKSFLLADAARTLRGMIDSVNQERNARFTAERAARLKMGIVKSGKRPARMQNADYYGLSEEAGRVPTKNGKAE